MYLTSFWTLVLATSQEECQKMILHHQWMTCGMLLVAQLPNWFSLQLQISHRWGGLQVQISHCWGGLQTGRHCQKHSRCCSSSCQEPQRSKRSKVVTLGSVQRRIVKLQRHEFTSCETEHFICELFRTRLFWVMFVAWSMTTTTVTPLTSFPSWSSFKFSSTSFTELFIKVSRSSTEEV